ncbi:hypothetical protein QEN19_000449 [Hanseniaspora menglaensis]
MNAFISANAEEYTVYYPLVVSLVLSFIGYKITCLTIPKVKNSFIKIGLFGKDLSKVGKPVIPETIGVIPSIVLILLLFINVPLLFVNQKDTNILFPYSKFSEFLSSILCLESILILGLLDDLFDLKWRHKFFLPMFASIPLLVVYYVDYGVTTIMVPPFLQNEKIISFIPFIGNTYKNGTIDLKILYYLYMGCVAIFCPNSINIFAGVNGLEVGQILVLSLIFLINDALYLFTSELSTTKHAHIFSSTLIIQLFGCSLALYKFNKFPAQVFVGDTFCYFAGMVFAVSGILGHFSKTVLLFFIPQIFNFAYSMPQLFGLVPCPRHRMPKFNEKDGLLYTSRAILDGKTAYDRENKVKKVKPFVLIILKCLSKLKLIDLEYDAMTGELLTCSNMTLINLVLVWSGPLREDKLCQRLLLLQFFIGIIAIFLRHMGGALIYGHDNLFKVH